MAKNKVVNKTKRTNGEGSIFQRKSDGKWIGSITIGYDEKGRQKKKIIYGKNQTDVAKNLSEISGRINIILMKLLNIKHLVNL